MSSQTYAVAVITRHVIRCYCAPIRKCLYQYYPYQYNSAVWLNEHSTKLSFSKLTKQHSRMSDNTNIYRDTSAST